MSHVFIVNAVKHLSLYLLLHWLWQHRALTHPATWLVVALALIVMTEPTTHLLSSIVGSVVNTPTRLLWFVVGANLALFTMNLMAGWEQFVELTLTGLVIGAFALTAVDLSLAPFALALALALASCFFIEATSNCPELEFGERFVSWLRSAHDWPLAPLVVAVLLAAIGDGLWLANLTWASIMLLVSDTWFEQLFASLVIVVGLLAFSYLTWVLVPTSHELAGRMSRWCAQQFGTPSVDAYPIALLTGSGVTGSTVALVGGPSLGPLGTAVALTALALAALLTLVWLLSREGLEWCSEHVWGALMDLAVVARSVRLPDRADRPDRARLPARPARRSDLGSRYSCHGAPGRDLLPMSGRSYLGQNTNERGSATWRVYRPGSFTSPRSGPVS